MELPFWANNIGIYVKKSKFNIERDCRWMMALILAENRNFSMDRGKEGLNRPLMNEGGPNQGHLTHI